MPKKKIKPTRYFVVETENGHKRVVRSSVAPTYCVEVAWQETQQRVVKTMNLGGFRARVWEDDPTKPLLPRTKVIVFERRKEALAFRDNDPDTVWTCNHRAGDGVSHPADAPGPNGKLSDRKVSKLVSVTEVSERADTPPGTEARALRKRYGGFLRTIPKQG